MLHWQAATVCAKNDQRQRRTNRPGFIPSLDSMDASAGSERCNEVALDRGFTFKCVIFCSRNTYRCFFCYKYAFSLKSVKLGEPFSLRLWECGSSAVRLCTLSIGGANTRVLLGDITSWFAWFAKATGLHHQHLRIMVNSGAPEASPFLRSSSPKDQQLAKRPCGTCGCDGSHSASVEDVVAGAEPHVKSYSPGAAST